MADLDSPDEEARDGRLRTIMPIVLAVILFAGSIFGLYKYLQGSQSKAPAVHNIALIKQPPPPPPKPPEKPPEPPKIKEEVKIDQPKELPKPEQAKAPDEKPASDKPLGLDADGKAGSDDFGLASNKGGTELTRTGGGGGTGAYYSGLLQRQFFEALTRNRKILGEQFRVVVKVWLGDDGKVQKADIVSGSGNAQVDDMIQLTLMEMGPLKDVPPSSMRPMQLRLTNRS